MQVGSDVLTKSYSAESGFSNVLSQKRILTDLLSFVIVFLRFKDGGLSRLRAVT